MTGSEGNRSETIGAGPGGPGATGPDRPGPRPSAAAAAPGPLAASPGDPDTMEPEPVDHVLAALADPTRRRLLDQLAARGEATATTLAERLPVSRQAIVKHLAVLDAAGLVSAVKVGREVRYAVRPAALTATARWLAALAADWDRRLATIKRIAEAAEAAEAAAAAGPAGTAGTGSAGAADAARER